MNHSQYDHHQPSLRPTTKGSFKHPSALATSNLALPNQKKKKRKPPSKCTHEHRNTKNWLGACCVYVQGKREAKGYNDDVLNPKTSSGISSSFPFMKSSASFSSSLVKSLRSNLACDAMKIIFSAFSIASREFPFR